MTTLDDLRKSTSPDQVRLLTLIWDHHLSKGKGVSRRVVHREFRPGGREVVREAMRALGGSIVYEGWENGEVYRVTLLGAVLSERGQAIEDLLLKYVSFARDAFEETPDRERLSREEIQKAFGLTDVDTDLLGKLIFFDNIFGVGGGTDGQGSWYTDLPRGVEDIAADARGYLHAKLLANYRPNVPTGSPDRERVMLDRTSVVEASEAPAEFEMETAGQARTPFEGFDLHPRIAEACARLYRDGHYAEAVFRASLALEKLVQEKSGRHDVSGSALMEQVFSPNGPALAFNALTDQTDRDKQKGMMLLFQGTVFAFRNPRAHKSLTDPPEEASETIMVISFLAKRLEQARPFTKAQGT